MPHARLGCVNGCHPLLRLSVPPHKSPCKALERVLAGLYSSILGVNLHKLNPTTLLRQNFDFKFEVAHLITLNPFSKMRSWPSSRRAIFSCSHLIHRLKLISGGSVTGFFVSKCHGFSILRARFPSSSLRRRYPSISAWISLMTSSGVRAARRRISLRDHYQQEF